MRLVEPSGGLECRCLFYQFWPPHPHATPHHPTHTHTPTRTRTHANTIIVFPSENDSKECENDSVYGRPIQKKKSLSNELNAGRQMVRDGKQAVNAMIQFITKDTRVIARVSTTLAMSATKENSLRNEIRLNATYHDAIYYIRSQRTYKLR